MRLLSILWITMTLFITVSTVAAAEIDGFRNFKWGMDQATFLESDQKSIEGHMGAVQGVEAFQLKNDDLEIGGIKADGIVYSFFKGKFTSVGIDFKGFDNFEKLMEYCKKVFGPVTGTATMKLEYYAGFDSPETGAMLLYQMSMPNSSYGKLYIYSKKLLN
jgi:hypothetical protein